MPVSGNNDPQTHWTAGVSLSQALFKFGDKMKGLRLRELYARNPTMKGLALLAGSIISNDSEAVLDQPEFRTAMDENNECMNLRRSLEEEVFGLIKEGALVGHGYALPRKPGDVPVEVPEDIWLGQINWENDTVKGNGLELVAVRLSRAPIPKSSQFEHRAPGRPSRRDQAVEAFEQLDVEGLIDRSKPLAAHFDAVRAKANELYPNQDKPEKGLGKHVLYETLRPLFE